VYIISKTTYKGGQTDLVIGLWSKFISRCRHAGLHYVYRLSFVPP